MVCLGLYAAPSGWKGGGGDEPAGLHQEEPLSARLRTWGSPTGQQGAIEGVRAETSKIQCVFFTSTLESNPILYEGICVGALAGTGLSGGERSRSQVVKGILESSGGNTGQSHS